MQKDLVSNFDILVSFGMTYGGKAMSYAQILVELGQLETTKLSTIVGDDGSRESKAKNTRFSNKIIHLGLRYFGKWLGLYLFYQIIDSPKQKLSLPCD